MPKKQIIVDILDTGEVRVETIGFVGPTCVEESKWLKTLLGKEQTRELKAVYHQRGEVHVRKHLPICG
jgi:hypothetical protein